MGTYFGYDIQFYIWNYVYYSKIVSVDDDDDDDDGEWEEDKKSDVTNTDVNNQTYFNEEETIYHKFEIMVSTMWNSRPRIILTSRLLRMRWNYRDFIWRKTTAYKK